MKKFPCLLLTGNKTIKRSLTMNQIEVCWITSARHEVFKHRKYFDLTLSFYGGEFVKAINIKRIPNGYINKFHTP